MADVTSIVKQCALEAGFDLVRITSAEEFRGDRDVALERLREGLMDGLPWYTEGRILRGSDPQQLLPGARSIISLGLSYFIPGTEKDREIGLKGKVARYALGQDYHRVMKSRMKAYVQTLSRLLDATIAARWYVDDGPMLDRAAAFRSGLGWFGKNTNILTSSRGSWVFLGQVVTDLDLAPDQPISKTCGNCVLCIEACPTGAITQPYVIDNPRCISHLTIENRGPIPSELRSKMEGWVFGCDICQDVCPVNRKANPAAVPIPPLAMQEETPGHGSTGDEEEPGLIDLAEVLEMQEEDFQSRFHNSPVKRAKLVGLQRNACVALGNSRDAKATPILLAALSHRECLVRGHAAWALGLLDNVQSRKGLEKALELEEDQWVREEIRLAIKPD